MTDQYRRGLDVELSGLGGASVGDPELRILSNIGWAIRRSILRIFLFGLACAVLAYLLTYTSDTKFTSSAKVMIETRVQTETQFTPQVSGLPLSLTSLESELQLLRSTDLIESVVDRLELHDDPEFAGEAGGISLSPIALLRGVKNALVAPFSGNGGDGETDPQAARQMQREATIERLQQARQIEQVGDTSAVYQIRVTSESAQKAALIANSLASEYLTVLTRMKRDDLGQSQQWLATRIGQIREDLNRLSSELEAHSIETPFSPEEYATIKAQRIKSEKRAQLVEGELAEVDLQIGTLRTLLDQSKTREAFDFAAEAGLLRNPDTAATVEEQTQALDDVIATLERKDDVLNAQRGQLNDSIATFKDQQVRQVQHDSVTKRIENEILVVETIYRDFVAQLGRRAEQGDYLDAGAHIIETARVSVDPSAPKRTTTAVAAMLAAIVIGLGFTVIRELLQKRLRTTFELESTTGVKLSAIIPEIKHEPLFESFFNHDGKLDPKVLQYGRKLLASSDIGLRTLRHDGEAATPQATEFFARNRDGKPGQRFAEEGCMIFSGASAVPDEGKTSTLLLIGSVCAQAGYRTLIIDCDTVSSSYRDLTKITADAVKVAAQQPLSFQDYVVGTPQDSLDVLPLIGAEGDHSQITAMEEFLCSCAFLNLLYALSDTYDVILLDTPPLLSAVEAGYLSQLSQRVILFTRWNNTPRNSVLQAMHELENAGVRPSAMVATRVDMKHVKHYGDPILG